jgi:hypothetical protein
MQRHSFKLVFVIFLLCYLPTHLVAQINTQAVALRDASKKLDFEARANYADAVIKAKKNGWAINYLNKNKSRVSLMGVDMFGQPIYYTSFADPVHAITVNTNKLWTGGSTGFNLNGSSDSLTFKLGMWDESAIRNSHIDIANRTTQKDNVTKIIDHSTHVAGILIAKGVNPAAKGMIHGSKGIYAYDWSNDVSEMSSAAAENLLVSNHSYGIVAGWEYNDDSSRWEYNGRHNEKEDYRFGLYDNQAVLYDSIAYNAPNYLIVKSSGNTRASNGPTINSSTGKWFNNDSTYWRRDQNGKWYNAGLRPDSLSKNDGYETLPGDVNAKNILTVGAVAGILSGYTKKEDVVENSFSTWGPTDDGRIKPDIVAVGVSVLSTLSTNDSSYGYSSGTSMSSPGVAGSLLLLQELSYKLTNKPVRSATLKALAIHTANEAGTSPGPDYKFGWGLMNSSEAATTLNNALSTNNASSSTDLVYEDVLQNQGSKTYNIVASGKKALKATLVWTDIKGVANNSLNNNTPKLVNDLDLKISSGNSVVETWNLNPANPSEAAKRGNNKIDNVEKVEIDSVIVGNTYTITVSHKNNLDRGSQAYSLIISGGGGAAYCTSTASSNAGTKIDSVTLNNILFANTTNNQYIDNTKQIINGEPLGNLNFSIKTSSTDASNNTRFIHIYIDYNNNGVFESTELASVSNALTNGIYAGTFNLPGNLTIGTITRLRIVAMETAASSNLNPCGAYSIGETQDYTIKINNPSNDLQLSDIVSPIAKACKTGTQYITVKIVNNGGGKQTNFPINVVVKKGSTTLRTITETFNGTLAGLENMNYTFQTPISLEENTSYDITATVSLNNDQLKENNSISSSFLTSAVTPAPSAIANNCNNSVQLRVNNPISSNRYFWYDSSSTINPVGQGASTVITSSASKLNVGSGYAGFIGPLNNKSLGTSGGYNSFSGNYVKINATSAMTIETTKLYTGNPGKIEFTLGTFASENSDGSYSYFPIQTVSLNVGASSPTPLAANGSSATPFIEGDSGRTYYLNLKIPQAGDYIIIVKCTDATLFRNNGLGNNTYPLGPNKVFSFTGNSVTAASGNFQNFFYFFYNTQISTNDCPSPLSSVPVSIVSKPIITQTNDSTLSASTANSYQWFVNDSSISGANNQTLIAKRNALYKVTTTTGSCSLSSDPKLVLVTNIIEASVKEISLKITSSDYIDNMIKGGSFYIQFSNIQSRDIKLDIINSMGERVFQKDKLVNQNGPQLININSLNAGIYFVRIFANNKVYIQRVFITQ